MIKQTIKVIKSIYLNLTKFIIGWLIWIIIFYLCVIFSLITWNWKETYCINMKSVIKQICGISTWNIMLLQ